MNLVEGMGQNVFKNFRMISFAVMLHATEENIN